MTRTAPVMPVVGDVWASKRREGYTVEVLKVEWRTYRWGQRVHEVTYRTKTTPAKRAADYDMVTTVEKFLKQFRKTYPGLDVE